MEYFVIYYGQIHAKLNSNIKIRYLNKTIQEVALICSEIKQ
jgi:hypothetical protein